MKKLVLPLIIGLALGLGVGYLIFRNNSSEVDFANKSVFEKFYADSSFGFTGEPTSHRINPDTARMLIGKYRKQNRRGIFRLKTFGDSLLNGYYIDRAPLDTILMDKSFTGVSFYFAKDRKADSAGIKKRTYTLVYMGTKQIK